MIALINKIIPYSFIDGPGSRMVVFFQGCNMGCLYCHNPETQNRCNSCQKCLAGCPGGALSFDGEKVTHHPALCRHCDRCLAECPHFSSPKCYEMSVGEILRHIEAARDFIDGITVSGGEASLQADFILELFQSLKNPSTQMQLTTFIDTNGQMSRDVLEKLIPVTDGFMVDLKAWDPERHYQLTGVTNQAVLENIRRLGRTGLLYEVRTVIVPGFTDDKEEIIRIATLVRELNQYTKLKLIPFRPMGVKTHLRNESLEDSKFQELFRESARILGERVTS